MKSLNDIPLKNGQTVLLRIDLDVPFEGSEIKDQTRILTSVPSVNFLKKKGAKLLLISHAGRPEGKDLKLSLKRFLPTLEKVYSATIEFQEDIERLPTAQITLLENIRFWPGEEANDKDFAQTLAKLGDFYVNDAFAVSHRAHASIVGLPKFLTGFAGLHLQEELKNLNKILINPRRPLIAIIGGAKLETKLPVINNLAKIADQVLVGGKLMFEVKDKNTPENVVVAVDAVEEKDIGPKAIAQFKKIILKAKTIVWNGPMGLFEDERYASGTREIAASVASNLQAFKLVGGGDTLAALNSCGLLKKMDYVSSGGGAMLDFLAGKILPGLEAIGYYQPKT